MKEAMGKYIAHMKELSVPEIVAKHLELDHQH
jgi:hypothetical protein